MDRSAGPSTNVIIDITLDPATFELGRTVLGNTTDHLELATPVPRVEEACLLVWMHGPPDRTIETDLISESAIQAVTRLMTESDRALFRIELISNSAEFFEFLLAEDIHILEASGTDDSWQFKLQFPDSTTLQTFRQFCEDEEIEFSVRRLYHPHADDYGPDFGLTPQQREALLLAVEEDYFTVPRACTTADIGEAIGISDQAVSERLRRAVDTLVSNTLQQQDQQPVARTRPGRATDSE